MQNAQTEIVICMGSSCFSRGNKKILQLIQQYLKDKGLQGKVLFRGSHCFGQCDQGPMLTINDIAYRQLEENQIGPILDQVFGSAQ
mgnify:CR=1 FL=1